MNPLNIILTILLFLSGVLTVILVLWHPREEPGPPDGHYRHGLHRLRHRHGTHLPAGNHRLDLAALNLVGASDFGRPLFFAGLSFFCANAPRTSTTRVVKMN